MSNSESRQQPKRIEVIARGVLHSQGRVLLCQDKEGGYLYLPGGHVEPGEIAAEALTRELEEEAGLREVRIGACALVSEQLFVQNGKPKHEINLVFHVERARRPDGSLLLTEALDPQSPPPTPLDSLESYIDFVWVESPTLPDLDLRPLSMKAWLMGGNQGLDSPGWISHSDR